MLNSNPSKEDIKENRLQNERLEAERESRKNEPSFASIIGPLKKKVVEVPGAIKQNDDKDSPYSVVWSWPDDYFKKSGENQDLMKAYAKTKDKTIIKKIKENIQYITSQEQLYINHLNKLLKRGDPDVTQDNINKIKARYDKVDEYYKKKLENLEK